MRPRCRLSMIPKAVGPRLGRISLTGQAGAMAIELFAARKLGAVLGGNSSTAILTGAEGASTKLASSVGFGAVMGGVLTPTDDPNSFWSDRFTHAFSMSLTMGTTTGISTGLEALAPKVGSKNCKQGRYTLNIATLLQVVSLVER